MATALMAPMPLARALRPEPPNLFELLFGGMNRGKDPSQLPILPPGNRNTPSENLTGGMVQQYSAPIETGLPSVDPNGKSVAINPHEGGGPIGNMFGWNGNPLYEGVKSLKASGILDDLAYGLTTGTNLNEGFQLATQRGLAMRGERQQQAEATQSKQKILQTLGKYGSDYDDIAEGLRSGAIDPKTAWNAMFSRHSDLAEQAKISAKNRGNASFLTDPTLKAAVESGAMPFIDAYKLERGGGGSTDYGMTPIWGQFPDGTFGYGVQGSDGNFHPVDTGDFTPLDPRSLYTERAAGSKIGAGEGTRTLEAPVAAGNVEQLNAKTDDVMGVIDKAIGQVDWDSTGVVGQVMGAFGGTKAYDLRRTAETVKANLGFAELQAMRDASPTGGALGSIAVPELVALQSTIENLDPNQSAPQLAENLRTIKTLMDRHSIRGELVAGGVDVPEFVDPDVDPIAHMHEWRDFLAQLVTVH